MTIEVQQTWWHIEEVYFPATGRKIRQVMDIFTNDYQIPFQIISKPFVGLKIIARNANNNEIAFLDNKDTNQIILNLDDQNKFPDAPSGMSKYLNMKHLKIEIEYILITTEYEEYKDHRIIDWIIPKRFSTQEVEGRIQPEFYLKLPFGWKMGKAKIEGDITALKCFIENQVNSPPLPTPSTPRKGYTLILKEPYIEIKEGKRTYHYLIDKECYQTLITRFNDQTKCKFKFYYQSEKLISIVATEFIPIIFFVLSLAIIGCAIYSNYYQKFFAFNISVGMPILIALLAYSFFHLNLIYQGFELRFQRFFFITFCLTLVSIGVILMMPWIAPTLCNQIEINGTIMNK